MSSKPIDYAPLLPAELDPHLKEAAAVWRSANVSQDAILMPLFTGIKGYEREYRSVISSSLFPNNLGSRRLCRS
jgi:hypothetical protein